ncbi:MAG TPA: Rne/Rng family ribonuclease [Blastocatellia bacterium]|nr:Rne/Rng family ribonuclease [Blastocatellia bacterium]
MTKELIISANVHEKKVCILEDGVVTEFYVERRDENQGVVGNLYKGRVMKVLPGMQSAFVDIGLERDAFLYVSDFTEFMEDEEEFDFKEVSEDQRAEPSRAEPARPEGAQPRAEDRQRRPDRRRQEVSGSAPQRGPGREREREREREPEPEAEPTDQPILLEDAVEQLAEIADESLIPPPPPDEELETDEQRVSASTEADQPLEADVTPVEEFYGERITDEPLEETEVAYSEVPPPERVEEAPEEAVEAAEAESSGKSRRSRSRRKAAAPEPEPEPQKKTARSKKKADKPDEPAAEASETSSRKTASKTASKRTSRRKSDKAPAEETESSASSESFERVTDEDLQDAGEMLKDAIVQEKIIDQTHEAEYRTSSFQPEPEPEWRIGSFRGQFEDAGFQRVDDDYSDAALAGGAGAVDEGPASGDGGESSGSPFRHISDAIPSELYERAQAESGGEISDLGGVSTTDGLPEDARNEAASEEAGEEDREASVTESGGRAEFAMRRGGRSRRRRRESPPASQSGDADEGAQPLPEEAEVEVVEAQAPARPSEGGRPEGGRAEGGRAEGGRIDGGRAEGGRAEGGRQGGSRSQEGRPDRRPDDRRPDDRRPEPYRRPDDRGRRPDRSEAGPSRRSERGGPPTISELLHEGQEILVQIAKEPIAKKGARITSHIALPGRYLVYMPTVNHVGVSRKIPSDSERVRLKRIVSALREREGGPGGFIARTACAGHTEQELQDDMRYLLRTWADVRKKAEERSKAPALVHRDLDLVQRIMRDQLSEEFSAIRVDNEVEFARIVEFVNRVQPKLVKRVKLYVGDQPILEKYGIQPEIDKAVRPRVWLRSGGYIVINQTEALVAIDVNTGKFVGKSDKLEDTITRTNLEAAKEIVRQVRLRDLGGIIVIDFIDMEERKNRQKVMMALQQELQSDRAPSKILSINDFGLVAITRKRVKQSLERTLCTPCPYCQGAGMVKSPQTVCFEILEQSKAMSRQLPSNSDVMLRVSPEVAEAFRSTEHEVLEEIEAYFGTPVTIESDPGLHQEQFDFAVQ